MLEKLDAAIKSIDTVYFDRNERDFAYELYHQLRKTKFPQNVEVTCETRKNRFSYNDRILDNRLIRKNFFTDETNINRGIHRYPDLLIHEYENRKNQLLALEIKKTIGRKSLLRDLSKLAVYCYGQLKYKKGVMIIVNPRTNQIIEIPEVKELLKAFPKVEIWVVTASNINVIN